MAALSTRPPHIGLNAQLLSADRNSYRSAGIHRYIAGLLDALPAVAPGLRYTAFVAPGVAGLGDGIRLRAAAWPTSRPAVRAAWEQVAQPWRLVRDRIDLLHSLAFVSPIVLPCPSVVTVYDLSFEVMPDRFPPANRLYLSTMTRLACRRARRVIAISHSTRADVARHYGVPLERIDVACPGVDPAFGPRPADEVEAFRRRRGLPERFVLYLGTIEPRKNLPVLIRAFARLNRRDVWLVLAGGRGWMVEEVFALLDELKVNDRVILPDFLPLEELPLWYGAAEVLAYPSAYEGFGLPPAEAMACGTPVVVSEASSLPEVVGDAGRLVPPGDEEALADCLRALLDDPAARDDLGRRGIRRARAFTWQATARATVQAYGRALGRTIPVVEAVP